MCTSNGHDYATATCMANMRTQYLHYYDKYQFTALRMHCQCWQPSFMNTLVVLGLANTAATNANIGSHLRALLLSY